jgi:hypothetical protein
MGTKKAFASTRAVVNWLPSNMLPRSAALGSRGDASLQGYPAQGRLGVSFFRDVGEGALAG